jgi:2-polyprenyl-3-methyl-5-hydroxy-6-metoxy-1,4-benzoquinol methylase
MTTTAAAPEAAIEELSGRLFTAGVAALELSNIHIGNVLGLYRALDGKQLTSAELAAATGCAERYIREWCQAMAVSGFLTASTKDAATARFGLADGVREVLIDELSPAYLAPLAQCAASVGGVLPALIDAFHTGEGVPYAAYGLGAVSAQAALNRPAYANDLVSSWIPAVPGLAERLADTANPVTVADLGCGAGWAAIETAKAYPHVRVDGYDADEASIAQARHNAQEHGVADRVRFEVSDLSEADDTQPPYEIAYMFECLHDMADPDGVLRATRQRMAPGGTLLIMEERTDDELIVSSEDPVQSFFAHVSPLWCVPQGLVGENPHPVGTVIRAAVVRQLASDAGFQETADVGIEHPFWRFFRVTA